jgi:hypothetical protein
MIVYFQYEKARLERKRTVEMSKGYGKPKVGGPFTLKDVDGIEFTEKDLLGKYTLVRRLLHSHSHTSSHGLECTDADSLGCRLDILWLQPLSRYLS